MAGVVCNKRETQQHVFPGDTKRSVKLRIREPWVTYDLWVAYRGRYEKTCAPFCLHGLTLIPAWTSNYIHYKMWDEITYPFLNLNGRTVEI